MKVYISGKIGEETLSEATRRKFARAEMTLRQKGYDVFNPTASGLGSEAEINARDFCTSFYQEILLLDLVQFRYCEAIYMLPDWESSPGALVELHYAMATGKRVMFAEAAHAWDYLEKRFSEQNKGLFTERARNEYIDSRMDEVWLPL